MKYPLLFAAIQLINLPLMVIGWIVCLPGFPTPWLWRNSDDIFIILKMSPWETYWYTAWRNPVGNLRHVKYVSGIGRPLWYWSNGSHYAKAGWLSNGYPCLSFGAGKGY